MTPIETRFDELQEKLKGAEKVVISGHQNADGDAVGAVGALRRHLEIEDKDVTALLLEPLSPRYGFMEFGKHYQVFDPESHGALIDDADLFIMCDLSTWGRLGPLSKVVEESDVSTVCFDHHPCENGGPADINLLDPKATATGRIAWDYINHVEGHVDREIAESVFVSICSDTGWFRYPNTSGSVMDLAAELSKFRLDLPAIYRAIYQSNSAAMLRLLGHATRTMNEECGGRFVWSFIRRRFIEDLGVERFDADPILDVMRSGDQVQVVALFTEQADGSVSVSLRSRGEPDMNVIARQFGGGGHVYASGTSFPPNTAEHDIRSMVALIRRVLRAE